MLSPHQFRARRDRRGKRVSQTPRDHQNHPERDAKRALDEELDKRATRSPKRTRR